MTEEWSYRILKGPRARPTGHCQRRTRNRGGGRTTYPLELNSIVKRSAVRVGIAQPKAAAGSAPVACRRATKLDKMPTTTAMTGRA